MRSRRAAALEWEGRYLLCSPETCIPDNTDVLKILYLSNIHFFPSVYWFPTLFGGSVLNKSVSSSKALPSNAGRHTGCWAYYKRIPCLMRAQDSGYKSSSRLPLLQGRMWDRQPIPGGKNQVQPWAELKALWRACHSSDPNHPRPPLQELWSLSSFSSLFHMRSLIWGPSNNLSYVEPHWAKKYENCESAKLW